jgi:tRNA (guanine37-N1)-methyltransferase
MHVDIITLFPGLFDGFLNDAVIKRATGKGVLEVKVHNLRDWTSDRHQTVDDYPFGGGAGMVLKPEPIFAAYRDVLANRPSKPLSVYFTPSGELLNQDMVQQFQQEEELIFLCGRYKGVDQRILDTHVDRLVSIGDYVLSGGELPAMVLLEAMSRLIPGVLNDIESALTDSHQTNLLEGPLYTRPEDFEGKQVPEVLLSGDHRKIADWRAEKAMEITRERRPDLWERYLKKNTQSGL